MLIQFVRRDVYTIAGDCEIRAGAYVGTRTEVWLHYLKGDDTDGFVGKKLHKARLGKMTEGVMEEEIKKIHPDASVDHIDGADLWED